VRVAELVLRFWLIEQLDDGHRGRVAAPESHFQDSQIAARALAESRPEVVEELTDRSLIA
jgi:hypothetical protein